MISDTERLDWVQTQQGGALVNDDNGRWAFVYDGMQDVVSGETDTIRTLFFIEKEQWHSTARLAIDAAIADEVE